MPTNNTLQLINASRVQSNKGGHSYLIPLAAIPARSALYCRRCCSCKSPNPCVIPTHNSAAHSLTGERLIVLSRWKRVISSPEPQLLREASSDWWTTQRTLMALLVHPTPSPAVSHSHPQTHLCWFHRELGFSSPELFFDFKRLNGSSQMYSARISLSSIPSLNYTCETTSLSTQFSRLFGCPVTWEYLRYLSGPVRKTLLQL